MDACAGYVPRNLILQQFRKLSGPAGKHTIPAQGKEGDGTCSHPERIRAGGGTNLCRHTRKLPAGRRVGGHPPGPAAEHGKHGKQKTLKLEDFPENERDIQMKKASTLKKMKNVESGLNIIDNLLKKYPEDIDLLNHKACWLQYLNQKEEALEIIQNLTKREPENGVYHEDEEKYRHKGLDFPVMFSLTHFSIKIFKC